MGPDGSTEKITRFSLPCFAEGGRGQPYVGEILPAAWYVLCTGFPESLYEEFVTSR